MQDTTIHVILASASPRRKELIHQIGWEADICPAVFEEAKTIEEAEERRQALPGKEKGLLAPFSGADLLTVWNAMGKAKAVYAEKGDSCPIVAADTVVCKGEAILGKPKDEDDARAMLSYLSGSSHEVKTGMAVMQHGKLSLHVETTKVYFRPLQEEEIDRYVAGGEPLDKAGAYGIQGKGAVLVRKIEGSYDNVVGLPLTALYEIVVGDSRLALNGN